MGDSTILYHGRGINKTFPDEDRNVELWLVTSGLVGPQYTRAYTRRATYYVQPV